MLLIDAIAWISKRLTKYSIIVYINCQIIDTVIDGFSQHLVKWTLNTGEFKMSDSLTESVARLYRAGSEHSQQTQKLREAVDSFIEWLMANIPAGFIMPNGASIYPSGEFVHMGGFDSTEYFVVARGAEHTRHSLNLFARLIGTENFLEKLSEALEAESRKNAVVTETVNAFLAKP